MPTTLIAAVLFVVLLIPGYLFQNGYRENVHIRRPDRDVYALAQAIAISSILICIVSVIVGLAGPDHVAAHLYDDDFHDGLNTTQAVALPIVVLLPTSSASCRGSW